MTGSHGTDSASALRVRVLALLITGTLASSITVPRLFRNGDGFEASTTAALAYFALFTVSALAAIGLIVYTAARFRVLGVADRLLGAVPFVLVVLVAIWIFRRI